MAKPSNTTSTEWQAQNKSWFYDFCISTKLPGQGSPLCIFFINILICIIFINIVAVSMLNGVPSLLMLNGVALTLLQKSFTAKTMALPYQSPADAASSTIGLFCTNNGSNDQDGRHVMHLRFYLTRLKRRESYCIAWPLTSRFSKHMYSAISLPSYLRMQ